MKTLYIRELRENISTGFVLLVLNSLAFIYSITQFDLNNYYYDYEFQGFYDLQTSLRQLAMQNPFGVGLFIALINGVAAGYIVFSKASQPDLWAFVIHRPASLIQIYWSKLLAAATLTSVCYLIPWSLSMYWLSIPGNIAIPFIREFLLPVFPDILTGWAYIQMGAIIALVHRQKFLRAILCLSIPGLLNLMLYFREYTAVLNFLIIILTLLILTSYQWFLLASSAARMTSLTRIITVLLVAMGINLVINELSRFSMNLSYVNYTEQQTYTQLYIKDDGTPVYLTMTYGGKVIESHSFEGKKTNESIGTLINYDRSYTKLMPISYNEQSQDYKPVYRNIFNYIFLLYGEDRQTLWTLIKRFNRIYGYDQLTSKPIGSLGPDGFTTNINLETPGLSELPLKSGNGQYCFFSSEIAYYLDSQRKAVESFFKSSKNDSIISVYRPYSYSEGDKPWYLVQTQNKLVYFDENRKQICEIPVNNRLKIEMGRTPSGIMAVAEKNQSTHTTRIQVYDPNGSLIKDLESRYNPEGLYSTSDNVWQFSPFLDSWFCYISGICLSPYSIIGVTTDSFLEGRDPIVSLLSIGSLSNRSTPVFYAVMATIIFLSIGTYLLCRSIIYKQTVLRSLFWAMITLLFGLAGIIALLCLEKRRYSKVEMKQPDSSRLDIFQNFAQGEVSL